MSAQLMLTKEGIQMLKKEIDDLTLDMNGAESGSRLLLRQRIQEINAVIEEAIIMPEDREPGQLVELGSRVTLQEQEFMDCFSMTIVHPFEASHLHNRVSILSPVGRAMLGKPLNAMIHAELPEEDSLTYRIVDIQNCRR
ncbi:GreA/GreB family elongation factor [Fictibacillus iocasae]|uniref:GreA/GreB family elongation factor n=1 Tax=Fictibacillus iocasae TaxID=2715437 RepID=A0ABW2NRZ3_9BACL